MRYAVHRAGAVQADRHLDPHAVQAAVALLEPALQAAGHEREDAVVDGRSLDLGDRAAQGGQPRRRKGDRALAPDATVKRRAPPRAGSLALKRSAEIPSRSMITLQVWPATTSFSSARMLRSSADSGRAGASIVSARRGRAQPGGCERLGPVEVLLRAARLA